MNAIFTLSTIVSIKVVMTFNITEYSEVSPCEIGNVIQNECVRCVCSKERTYTCNSLYCDENELQIKKHVKESPPTVSCKANMIYILNKTKCICNKDGQWPHGRCEEVFRSLPPTSSTKQQCDEDGYIVVDCNVCRCNELGEVIESQCTKNICGKNIKSRRSNTDVYGECELKKWYSLAPCQFCYCVNVNKLICNTGNFKNKKLQLGTYSLTVCEKDVVREGMEMLPGNSKPVALRQGELRNKKIEVKAKTSKETTVRSILFLTSKTNNLVNDANRDINMNILNKEENDDDVNAVKRNEFYIDSDENNSKVDWKSKLIERNGKSTQLPYLEDEDNLSADSEDQTNDGVKLEPYEDLEDQQLNVPRKKQNTSNRELDRSKSKNLYLSKALNTESFKQLTDSLKIVLPKVLDKVLSMALRRSAMVTLETNKNCQVGSEIQVKCNRCFCLKSGKLLCTNKLCA